MEPLTNREKLVDYLENIGKKIDEYNQCLPNTQFRQMLTNAGTKYCKVIDLPFTRKDVAEVVDMLQKYRIAALQVLTELPDGRDAMKFLSYEGE